MSGLRRVRWMLLEKAVGRQWLTFSWCPAPSSWGARALRLVPKPDCVVVRGRCKPLAIGREHNRIDPIMMALECLETGACPILELDGLVARGRREPFAVRREHDRVPYSNP